MVSYVHYMKYIIGVTPCSEKFCYENSSCTVVNME